MTVAREGLLSIWLLPDEPGFSDLWRHIDQIAERSGSPRFAPHVTLLGDLPVGIDVLEAVVAPVVFEFLETEFEVTGVSQGDSFHKSLYLDLKCRPSLSASQRAIEHALPKTAFPRAFQPHISIAYGSISLDEKSRFQHEMVELVGDKFRCGRVALVRSNQNLAVEDWRVLKEWRGKS